MMEGGKLQDSAAIEGCPKEEVSCEFGESCRWTRKQRGKTIEAGSGS